MAAPDRSIVISREKLIDALVVIDPDRWPAASTHFADHALNRAVKAEFVDALLRVLSR